MDWGFDRTAIQDEDLALYRATPGGPLVLSFLYLGADRGGWSFPPSQLSLRDSWRARGVYFFSADYREASLAALRDVLVTSGQNDNRGVAWVCHPGGPSPRAFVIPVTWVGEAEGRVTTDTNLPFLDISLRVAQSTRLRLDFGHPSTIELCGVAGAPPVLLCRGTEDTLLSTGHVTLALFPDDPGLGQLRFAGKWRARDFFRLFRDDLFATEAAWGGELRYVVQLPGEVRPRQLVYPMFPSPRPSVVFQMAVTMDPLSPTDAHRTAFTLDAEPSALAALDSSFARTTGGAPVRLIAEPGVGFYIGRRVSCSGDEAEAYLATFGTFRCDLGEAERARLMCGLTTQEYLTIANGDRITFLPGYPAFVDLQDRDRGLRALRTRGEAPLLHDCFTTSWVAIRPAQSREEGGRGVDYFAQPPHGTSFDHAALQGTTYAAATTARVASAEESAPFPMALYGGIYPPDESTEGWPNVEVPPSAFIAVEETLATIRFSVISAAARGAGPRMCSLSGELLDGGRSATPTGVVLELGSGSAFEDAEGEPATPVGGWAGLVLGQSDKGPIRFGKGQTGEVNPALARALLSPQCFLVLNDWDRFPEFEGFASVQGIDVNLAPAPGDSNRRETILVIKHANTDSLEALVSRVETWADPSAFVGDGEEVRKARESLQRAIKWAKEHVDAPGKPFQYFLEHILVDPEWTGFLCFNAAVDGRGMPTDLQMVLGGIEGRLRVHHFGAELSRLRFDGDQPAIQCTSFAGVVFHDESASSGGQLSSPSGQAATSPAPYAFRTTRLIVEIRNSTIRQFTAQVAFTLNQLFERPVRGDASMAPNTVCLDGEYQVTDGVGRVVFESTIARAFEFRIHPSDIRVLDRFVLRGARLSPLTSSSEPPDRDATTMVASLLSLDGELAFVADFPGTGARARETGSEPLDLFGYGVPEGGLPISGLSFTLEFDLGANGREGDIRITPRFSDVIATDRPERRRPTSLVASLPLQLTGLLAGAAALDAIKRTGKVLNVPDLVATSGAQRTGELNQVAVLNATTPTPWFALAFELPLGSLGDLADTGVGLTCTLVLGWGPNAAMPDADGVALYVQLPQLVGGLAGFDLQGFIKTTFGDANLARVRITPTDGGTPRSVYVLLFNNVALSIFGIALPPKVVTDFILFCDPSSAGSGQGGRREVGWSLAATGEGSR
jgi:hypothetical protein